MKKDIKDYLHLYLGQRIQFEAGEIGKLEGVDYKHNHVLVTSEFHGESEYLFSDIKLIIRPLSDMTMDEKLQIDEFQKIEDKITCPRLNNFHMTRHGEQFRYLLKQGFDLFGLIPEGLTIDKTTL